MAGRIASFYYLQHSTLHLMMNYMHPTMDFKAVLKILCSSPEYDELPVRPLSTALLSWQLRLRTCALACSSAWTCTVQS